MTELHCWTGKTEYMEEKFGYGSEEWAEAFNNNGTCMLPDGHEGEHEFTPDNQILVTFPDKEKDNE